MAGAFWSSTVESELAPFFVIDTVNLGVVRVHLYIWRIYACGPALQEVPQTRSSAPGDFPDLFLRQIELTRHLGGIEARIGGP